MTDEERPPEFDPPETATPGPPPGAPPTPPPPTRPMPEQQQSPPPAQSPYGAAYAPPPSPDAQPYGYPQGQVAGQKTNGKAVASLVLGIAGWLVAPFILSVLGIIFGAMARKEIAQNPTLGGRGMANWGFWLSITGLAAWVVLIAVLVAAGNK
jgi:Domain of unknown function (DUF4190)